jgi:hypothetical protein
MLMLTSSTVAGQKADLGTSVQAGLEAKVENEAVKDQVDDALPKGPKRADQSTGGRVVVGETGDLHDLAARRHS